MLGRNLPLFIIISRDFLLITLSQAERRGVDPQERIARLSCTFRCPSIVVSKEKHEEGGFHFHLGVKNEGAPSIRILER